jgi:hypothetical protein
MAVVADSISRSSPVRSVKPGSTCLACSLSSAVTETGHQQMCFGDARTQRTLRMYASEDGFDLLRNVDPLMVC